MPFPNTPREVYTNNPLNQVICQLRFPTILRIDTEIPAKFQEAIRQDYPLYKEQREVIPDIPKNLLEQIPSDFKRLLGTATDKKSHAFSSIDEKWVVALTRDFIALTSNSYTTWGDFKNYFSSPFETLLENYKPALFTRVGLRYQNVIQRSVLGLQDTMPWTDLIQPYIAGPLGVSSGIDNFVESTNQVIEIRLQNEYGKVKIRHGIAVNDDTGEKCYLIDSDFFAEKIKESENVLDRLERFNRRAGRLFRWCITPALREAMGPRAT